MTTELTGGCLCGFIRFKTINPVSPCDICQKHTGAQTVVWLEFSSDGMQWYGEGGRPSLYRSSETSGRAFCQRCGSSLGAVDNGPNIALQTGVFDQHNDGMLTPDFHSFEDMKPDWWRSVLLFSASALPLETR